MIGVYLLSPTSPLSPSRAARPTLEIITKHSVMEEFAAGMSNYLNAMLILTN